MSRVDLVGDPYRPDETGDRALVERRPGDDFFSAPPDVGIDRARYYERCWPNPPAIAAFEYHPIIEAGDDVVVTYETTRTDDCRFRKPQTERAPC
jgi:hypothetical protein